MPAPWRSRAHTRGIRVPTVRHHGIRLLFAVVVLLLQATPRAATITVRADGDLQAALQMAQPGDTVVLEAGATYVGNFRLPAKDGNSYIVIRSGGDVRRLPRPGSRISPAHAPLLAKLKSPNEFAALTADPGAHHWRVELLEFLANANGAGDIVTLGTGSQSAEQMPKDVIFDRALLRGDPLLGQKRGIALNSGATHIINSYISDIKRIGQDSQAIAGWNGSGPYVIENNYLEGAAENILFGGADPSVPDLVPSDITIRRNYFTKPLEWRGQKWQVKNAFELKNARRVLVEGNVFEHVWAAAQTGYAIVFTPRNQGGRAPWSVVEDVTFRYNVVRHAGNGFNITGYDDEKPSAQAGRIRISHNLVYDINRATWGGEQGTFLMLGNQPRDITVEHNTVQHTGNVVTVYGKRNGGPAVVEGFVFRDNLMRHNTYGVKGDNLGVGSSTLDVYFRGLVFGHNVLAGGKASQYPAGNYFPTVDEFMGSFVNAAEANFALLPGSPFRAAASDGSAVGVDLARLGARALP